MGRQIKFRGKRTDSGKWACGYYLQDLTSGKVRHYIFNCPLMIEVIPETVGQFTGLYDMNGKEIYEDDILKIGNQKACVHYGGCRFFAWHVDWLFDYNDLCEIIDDVHDNKELLTTKIEEL
jgi:hypothetical protein